MDEVNPTAYTTAGMGILDIDKIRTAREKLGLSQASAADEAGVTRQRWNDIEGGRKPNIQLETLEKVAKALKVKPKDLLK